MTTQGHIFYENGMKVTQFSAYESSTDINWELSYKEIGCDRYSITVGCGKHGIVYYDYDAGLELLNHILSDIVRFANFKLDWQNWAN